MKCKDVRKLLGAYLYGDLEPEDMREVRLHAQTCDECRADLESRGTVVASLSAEAPVLNDEEKERIARSVKRAVVESESGNPVKGVLNPDSHLINESKIAAWWLRPASAVVLAILLLAGFAIGRHIGINSGTLTNPNRSAEENTTKPVVIVTETPHPAKPNTGGQTPRREDGRSRSRSRHISNIADYARRFAAPAVTGPTDRNNSQDKRKYIIPDEPVSVAAPSETKKEEGDKGTTKLPKPTGLNDARTTNE